MLMRHVFMCMGLPQSRMTGFLLTVAKPTCAGGTRISLSVPLVITLFWSRRQAHAQRARDVSTARKAMAPKGFEFDRQPRTVIGSKDMNSKLGSLYRCWPGGCTGMDTYRLHDDERRLEKGEA